MRIKEHAPGCGARESNIGRGEMAPSTTRAARSIDRALAAISNRDLLEVMACPISPESSSECLVCRLVNPADGWKRNSSVVMAFARKFRLSCEDASELFLGAASHTKYIEEKIAERLDDILFGKSVGSAR